MECKVYNSFGMSEVFGQLVMNVHSRLVSITQRRIYISRLYLQNQVSRWHPGEIGVGVYTHYGRRVSFAGLWSGDLLRIIQEPCLCGSCLP